MKTKQADTTYQEFAEELDGQSYSFRRGDIVTGRVVQFDGNKGAYVDIGSKSAAFLSAFESSLKPVMEADVSLNEQREFQIVSDENDNGQLYISIRRLEIEAAWEKVMEAHAED